jgi:hypothetical protein
MGENNIYLWDDRVRFPVAENNLSRTLRSNNLYWAMICHESQEFRYSAMSTLPAIINGDKVFWRRSTDSLLRFASLAASSGDPSLLNDFMLLDTRKLSDPNHDPFDGVWSPEEGDEEKTVTVRLNSPSVVREVVLYDNPHGDINILNAEIRFDNGAVVETGPLDVNGAPTRIAAESGGADALSLINTLTGMKIDIERGTFALANRTGGLSGPAIRPVAVRMVYEASHAVKIPVIGMGGIASAEDALEFLMAGARAVSVGTANFHDPCISVKIADGIGKFLERKGIRDVNEIVGCAGNGGLYGTV